MLPGIDDVGTDEWVGHAQRHASVHVANLYVIRGRPSRNLNLRAATSEQINKPRRRPRRFHLSPLIHLTSCSLLRGRLSPRSRRNSSMQIATRALVFAVVMLASTPLLAASSTSTSGTDASAQETQATTEQENCTPPPLPPTNLSPDKLASLLPKPGSTPPDPVEVDRHLSKAASCARALGIRAPGEDNTPSAAAKETKGSTSNRATDTQSSSPAGS
jgi:hypothetical protein